MSYHETRRKLAAHRVEIAAIRERMRALQAGAAPEPVIDYRFEVLEGHRWLSELFGEHATLFVVHNMGVACNLCTTWADGYNGVYPQLSQRAAMVIAGPDAPEVQARHARTRSWRFAMVSHRDTTFAQDMGYRSDRGQFLPGLSVFRREPQGIVRIADTSTRPGDDFNPLCGLLELLPEGWGNWIPTV